MSSLAYTGEQPPPRFNMARYCIGRAAAATPDKIALIVVSDAAAPIDQAETWTYRALDDAVRRIAAGLLAEGMKPGDRLMIRMPNTSTYVLMVFGAIAAGIVPLPSSAQLTESEAAFLLSDSDATALAAPASLALSSARLLLDELAIERIRSAPPLAAYADTAANDPALLIYTSGTTRQPKGVLHGHRSAWGRRPMYVDWEGIGPQDRMLHAGAFNWTYTFGVGITDPWANGATAILYNGPKDIAVWPRLIAATRATIFAAVPSIFRQILKYCELSQYDLAALRHGLAAGEALPPQLAEDWRRATGSELYEAFGMSECSTFVSMPPGEPARPGSSGKVQRGRAVEILPIDGGTEPLRPNETGIVAVHRDDPGLMLGYWRRPDEESAARRGDWFISGDLAAIDADGYFWHKGRADDLMNAGGFRVSPLEVEAALADHPSVAEVAVAERAVRADVRIIVAFVIASEGFARDAKAIMSHASERLAPYKRPREIVFVESLPRSANGKLLRRALPQLIPTNLEHPA